MKYKYSLVDDESDLVIGYCNRIEVLKEEVVQRENNLLHKLVLFDFISCNDFKEYLKRNKEGLVREININILDDSMKSISKFRFFSHTDINNDEFYSLSSYTNFELVGYLNEVETDSELRLLNQWLDDFPKEKNKWISLDYEGRYEWLKMLRIMYYYRYNQGIENSNNTFYLDGSHITTYDSFFIALAEALNGPGSYMGTCLAGLDDLLFRRKGVSPPFKLVWENASIAIKHLDEEEWSRHRLYIKEFYDDDDEDDDDFVSNLNIFHAIIDVLISYGVEVVLKP